MAHLGNEATCAPYTYADVIANTTGIDAFLDGHSHDTDQEMCIRDRLMAMSTLITVPTIILFVALQKYFVQGITKLGIK